MEGTPVYEARKRIGAELARESHVPADVVVPVPDSGVPAAMGYAAESGMPFELGIIRNHYVGRTFIEPTDQHPPSRREAEALRQPRRCWRASASCWWTIRIVRGTTSRKIVEMVRAAGAREVHMRISSPPTTHSCFYGIDTPERGKLLAARHSVEEMARADRRRQPGLHLDRRAVPRARQAGRDAGAAALLRRLLHRRLPDPAAGSGRQRRAAQLKPAGRRAADGDAASSGRVALVTGASRGIGAATAIELARRGAHVVITARTAGRAGGNRRRHPRRSAARRRCCRST